MPNVICYFLIEEFDFQLHSKQSISALVKKWAALNSRSLVQIASGAQLALSNANRERRSTRAREKMSGARERRSL